MSKADSPSDHPSGRRASDTESISKAHVDHVENYDMEKVSKDDNSAPADHFGTSVVYSPAEKALVKKLDWHILPIVFAMYFMNKLDQNAIANARLDGLEKDLKLTGNQFNICVSILYVGYTLIQVRRDRVIPGEFNARSHPTCSCRLKESDRPYGCLAG